MIDRVKKIAKMYGRGKTLRSISEEIGMSHEWVRNNLPDDIIRHRKKNEVDHIKVIELFKKSGSLNEVTDKFKISRNWAMYILDCDGIDTKKRKLIRRYINGRAEEPIVKRKRPE